MPITPTQARALAHKRWAHEADRTQATLAARRGLELRFEREVDPDGVLPPDERAKRANNARRAFYASLSTKAVQARRKAAGLTE